MNKRSNQEEPDAYVSFSRALELFKPLNKNAFNYRNRKKEIATKEDESGKTLYGAQSVIAVRNALLKRASRRDKQPEVIIDWLKPTDIPASLALDPKDRRTCYAYLGLIPLPESVILDILIGKKDEKEITPDEILSYDQPGEYTLLANSAVVHPDYPELMSKVITAIAEYWLEQYPERRIKRIYAQAVSEEGRTMAQKLYLGPLYILQNQEMVRIEDAYVLDLNDIAASRIIRQFQEKLRAKAEHPPT